MKLECAPALSGSLFLPLASFLSYCFSSLLSILTTDEFPANRIHEKAGFLTGACCMGGNPCKCEHGLDSALSPTVPGSPCCPFKTAWLPAVEASCFRTNPSMYKCVPQVKCHLQMLCYFTGFCMSPLDMC